MSGKIKGPEYDAECRSLIHQYEMSSQSIANFDINKFFNVSYTYLLYKGLQLNFLSECFKESQRKENWL